MRDLIFSCHLLNVFQCSMAQGIISFTVLSSEIIHVLNSGTWKNSQLSQSLVTVSVNTKTLLIRLSWGLCVFYVPGHALSLALCLCFFPNSPDAFKCLVFPVSLSSTSLGNLDVLFQFSFHTLSHFSFHSLSLFHFSQWFLTSIQAITLFPSVFWLGKSIKYPLRMLQEKRYRQNLHSFYFVSGEESGIGTFFYSIPPYVREAMRQGDQKCHNLSYHFMYDFSWLGVHFASKDTYS